MNNIIIKPRKDIKAEVLEGLLQTRKRLPCKLFYDEKGSMIFEEITRLNEYYLTRTELSIMSKNIEDICSFIKEDSILIEFGSGSSTKTRLLFDYADDIAMYVPVDISEDMLLETVEILSKDYPELPVYPVVADYTTNFRLPGIVLSNEKRVVYFPGSTIGNFTKKEVVQFLGRIRNLCGKKGGFLVGVDLKKDKKILHDAYNDREGITAKFNLHILERVNKDFCTDFNPDNFKHKAVYNGEKGRVEMYLVSLKDQTVKFDNVTIPFKKGELILTEYSYKYTLEEFGKLVSKYFNIAKTWTDENNLFSVMFLNGK